MSRSGLRWIFALLVMLRGAAWCGQPPPVLRAEARVQGETIHLADLLPADAVSATRISAARISLGRAPEPGSFRVFSAEELRSAVAGQMTVKFPSQAVVRGAGWPLRDASIRRALVESAAGRHYDFSEARLISPADFSTRTPDPQLEVLAIHPETDARKLSASLRCQRRSDCGSFLVEVDFEQALPSPPPTTQERARAESTGAAKSSGMTALAGRQVAMVQPGRPAKMLFEGAGFRITTRVLPLQRAGLGQMVRVFDPAARRVSLAQVQGQDLLNFREAR